MINDEIVRIGNEALDRIDQAGELSLLDQARVQYLGKKGKLSEVLKGLKDLSAEERPKVGALANEWKEKIEHSLGLKKSELQEKELQESISKEKIDISLPARLTSQGGLHIITQTTRKIISTLNRIGFDVVTGPEAETEFLNFDAVNIPESHPARDMQDTFFLGPGVVLRTHTTAVQMRVLRSQEWPVRILCPGAVFRADSDATHTPMFHQIEALWIDKNVTMSDLKGTLEFFAREIFGAETKIRLRPSYFPFVEPGAKVDVSCFQCVKQPQSTCRICKGTGWLEILGAGMVHPALFEVAGYSQGEPGSPDELSGFAFGIGIERIAMFLHQVPDLRLMFQGDLRFLKQF